MNVKWTSSCQLQSDLRSSWSCAQTCASSPLLQIQPLSSKQWYKLPNVKAANVRVGGGAGSVLIQSGPSPVYSPW